MPTQRPQNLTSKNLYPHLIYPLKINVYVPLKWPWMSCHIQPCHVSTICFRLSEKSLKKKIFHCCLGLMFCHQNPYCMWLPHEQTLLSLMWNLVSALAVCKSMLQHTFEKDNQQLQPTRTPCITFPYYCPFDRSSKEFLNSNLHLPACSLSYEPTHDANNIHWDPDGRKHYYKPKHVHAAPEAKNCHADLGIWFQLRICLIHEVKLDGLGKAILLGKGTVSPVPSLLKWFSDLFTLA